MLAGMGSILPQGSLLKASSGAPGSSEAYKKLVFDLLKDWLDGLMAVQVINPSDPTVHGMLECPACDVVHARLMDAVYPFLYMAKASGDHKYLDAGIALMEWGDNVSRPDGAWTNELKPDSWDGITVFGAIALGEALYYHGDLLDSKRCGRWTRRLAAAAEFCYRRFPEIDAANINYGATNLYAMNLLGRLLDEPRYLKLSHKLARQIKSHFTEENTLLHGEKRPPRDKLSPKGLTGIDLGYNVEESFNGIVMYALEEKDDELLQLAIKSMKAHLQFMIPDGGWDNSWGTRMFKWTYWGSRTSDGCQPAFSLAANHNPAFGTAAVKNTELLRQCTADGLLHGGPHYASHGIKPCVHHTFAHVKPLACVLDHWDALPEIDKNTPLPREIADGVKHFGDLDVALFARGDWRGTVSGYDAEYDQKQDYRQATGGSLALLYHKKAGLLCAASMAVYKLVEVYNQQPAPGEDFALTPRVETFRDGVWYTNLFDLSATFEAVDRNGDISIEATAQLRNEARDPVGGTASQFSIQYKCSEPIFRIRVETGQEITQPTAFVLPVISPSGEEVARLSPREISIRKPGGRVLVRSSAPIAIKEMPRSRTFNMVPGLEAVPLIASFPEGEPRLEISIEVSA